MKYIIAALLLAQVTAFTTVGPYARAHTHLAAEYKTMDGEGKINLKVRPIEIRVVGIFGR